MSRRLLVVCLAAAGTACAPLPTRDTAIIEVEHKRTFPFVMFDFGSASLFIRELDGKRDFRAWAVLAPGRRLITVQAQKGPTGPLGTAAFLGACRGHFDVQVQAGGSYGVRFRREKEAETLQLVDRTTEVVVLDVPCVPSRAFE